MIIPDLESFACMLNKRRHIFTYFSVIQIQRA
jgi:hypothetical protein